ncbi:lytic transglycosylase domain-containing protein [Microbacterium sp.]|jgi:hypothetical protein|uniref:aggregation-promoting factor C-terminal-like domain-containing protein n=1 Tax=Microbacterium sp. TaxID=51671 RepID=UPI002B757ACD|nr:lytic transglycosylase domain-containing protein [Microbacterium sp.]HWL76102.1 lytic transglycosylase domain-containing protein [Microbacterium sp.]
MRSSTATSSTSSTPVAEHSAPARRNRRLAERRARRRPLLFATGLGLAVATIVGCAGAMPLSSAEASVDSAPATPYMMLASYSTPAPLSADAELAVSAADTATIEAKAAVEAADAAVASAAKVAADIEASGLDIGVATTTVDTTQLEETADRLELSIESLPESLLPSVTEDVTALVASVQEQVSGLRGRLDAAVQAKKEAEEKARREAEEKARQAAEAAERARQQQSSGSGGGGWVPSVPVGGGSGDNSPAGAQATARGMLGSYGWGDDQFGCLYNLWQRESGWNYQAYNASSGAFGIPQALPGSKMASAGADWQTSARTQIAWGLGYISGRYGTPCNAWGHSQSVGWY